MLEPEPLPKVASRRAFWSFDIKVFEVLRHHVKVPPGKEETLAQNLLALIVHCLGCSEIEVLEIMRLRLGVLAS